jgi:hypothetical protein
MQEVVVRGTRLGFEVSGILRHILLQVVTVKLKNLRDVPLLTSRLALLEPRIETTLQIVSILIC